MNCGSIPIYEPAHEFERLLPAGTLELVINLSGESLRCYHPGSPEGRTAVHGPLLSGARAEFTVVDTASSGR